MADEGVPVGVRVSVEIETADEAVDDDETVEEDIVLVEREETIGAVENVDDRMAGPDVREDDLDARFEGMEGLVDCLGVGLVGMSGANALAGSVPIPAGPVLDPLTLAVGHGVEHAMGSRPDMGVSGEGVEEGLGCAQRPRRVALRVLVELDPS